ncbi:MAG: gliding motility-associated C-terminal domain-containing protein [Prolixibacteraceae bacterium]|nr:gliding motility-associated C-terminal domain-containing protein [Prolixibacteraceae bacterium]
MKRLSTALIGLACIGNFVLGANNPVGLDATNTGKGNPLAAPLSIDFELEQQKPTCFGDEDGKIFVTVEFSTGTGPFRIEYKSSSSPSYLPPVTNAAIKDSPVEIPNLRAGYYDIRVTDLSNYDEEEQTDYRLIQNTELFLNETVETISCSSELGQITLNAGGGDNTSYAYFLYNSSDVFISPDVAGGNVYSGLNEDIYRGRVVDNNGCPQTLNGIIIEIPDPISPTVTAGSINCPGETTTITVSNLPADASSYQIQLDGETPTFTLTGSQATITNVSGGTHSLRVIRPDCPSDNWPSTGTHTISIPEYLPIGFSWDTDPNLVTVNCFGNDTTLTVTVTGGQAGKAVSLNLRNNDSGDITPLSSNLAFGASVAVPGLQANVRYTLIAEDVSGACTPYTYNFNINGPGAPFVLADLIETHVTCNGYTDGKIKVVSTGGNAPLYYSTDNGTTFSSTALPADKTITGLAANSYNVVLRDANGCETNPLLATITEPNPISVAFSPTHTPQLTCPGGANGRLMAVTTGGTKPYYYTLTDDGGNVIAPYNDYQAGDSISFSNLEAGTYTVTVTGGECADSDSDDETINPVPEVNISVNYTPVVCRDEMIGSFNIIANGGDGTPFTYSLSANGTPVAGSPKTETIAGNGVTFNDLEPGKSYHIEAWYRSCEPKTKDTLIVNPRELNVSYPSEVELDCPGGTTDITVHASGNYPFFISTDGVNYESFNGASYGTHTLSGLTAGNYSYYIKDNNECLFNDGLPINIEISEPSAIIVDDYEATDVTCKGAEDGTVTLQLSGGTPGYNVTLTGDKTYSQSSSDGTVNFPNVAAVTNPAGYSVTITDSKGCSALNTPAGIVVQEPAEEFEILEPEVIQPALCHGDSAIIRVEAVGGWNVTKTVWIEAYGFKTEEKSSGSTFKLRAGNYVIHARNADGCSARRDLYVFHPPRLYLYDVVETPVSCAGAEDAEIQFSVRGGTPSPTGELYWQIIGAGNPPEPFTGTTLTIDGTFGEYELVITDENGCSSNIQPVKITEPDTVKFEYLADSVTCSGMENGKIMITTASGGNDRSYSAYITPPGGAEYESLEFSTINGLGEGTYQVRITDSKGCSSETKNIEVGEPNPIILNNAWISDSIKCYNDANGEITVEAVGGGPYTLQYRVTGRDYQSDPIFTGLASGEYEVWVQNNMGNCEEKFTEKLMMTNPSKIELVSLDKTDQRCHNEQNGEVKITAGGGTGTLTYTLVDLPADVDDNPNTNGLFRNLGELNTAATNYDYKITDRNECEITGSFSIINPAELVLTEIDHHQIYCNDQNDGWIKLNVTGGNEGYTFKKDYTDADVTDDVDPVTNNDFTLENFAGGFYQPAVIDVKGCSDTIREPIEIVNPQRLIIDHIIAGDKRCNFSKDDTTIIVLDVVERGTPPYEYSIDGGESWSADSVFINLRDRIVSPRVRDAMDCPAQKPDTSIVWPEPFRAQLTKNEILCYDDPYGTIAVEISGGTGPYYMAYNDDILFDDPILIENDDSLQVITVDTVGQRIFYHGNNYSIMLKDDNDCPVQEDDISEIDDVIVSYMWERPEQFILEKVEPHRAKCAGDKGSIKYFTSGGVEPFNYWVTSILSTGEVVPANQDIDGLVDVPTGSYYAHVMDANGCIPTPDAFLATEIVAQNDTVKVEIETIKQPYCPATRDGIIGLDVLGYFNGGVWYWIEKYDTVYNEYNYVYEALITREEATDSQEVAIENPAFPDIDPQLEMEYDCENYIVEQKLKMGTYRITFEDVNTECWVEYSFTLGVDTMECEDIFPLFFTPNDDGHNDEWIVTKWEKSDIDLKIFNAAGEMVRHIKGQVPEDGLKWDGLDDKGRPVPAGTYMYIYQPDVTRKNEDLEYNTITLFRNY